MIEGAIEQAGEPAGESGTGYRYDVEVLHLLVSPGHNYFGRPRDGAGSHPTTRVAVIRCWPAGARALELGPLRP